jgi:polyisoprenoid-binding protein YceI
MRSTSTVPAPGPGALAGGSSWRIDPAHSHVEFAVRHLMISSVKGAFGDVQGTVWVDESDPTTVLVDVAIQVASIDTRQEQRDAHLRSPDFFDAAKFPTITFRSRRVQGHPLEGDFRLTGDLTIRGITREVTLDVSPEGRLTDPWGEERAGFSAQAKIILYFASNLRQLLGERGRTALERLMGMLLVIVAVQMLMRGVADYLRG